MASAVDVSGGEEPLPVVHGEDATDGAGIIAEELDRVPEEEKKR